MSAISLMLLGAACTFGALLAVDMLTTVGRSNVSTRWLAMAFTLISLQSALLAVFAEHEYAAIITVRALLTLVIYPVLYLGLLTQDRTTGEGIKWRFVHTLPLTAGLLVIGSGMGGLIDLVLFTTQIGYGVAAAVIVRAQFRDSGRHHPSFFGYIIAFYMSLLTLIDLVIFVHIEIWDDQLSAFHILFAGLTLWLFIVHFVSGAFGRPSLFDRFKRRVVDRTMVRSDGAPTREHQVLAEKIVDYLACTDVLADARLSVATLARRLEVPPRQVSEAVNRVLRMSFSELVNQYRVDYAKHILDSQKDPCIQDAMFASGFSTKSNYYKQFSRIVGCPPGEYVRRKKALGDARAITPSPPSPIPARRPFPGRRP